MPSGVGTGVDEPGWRPLGWRGLTGLNEPSYNGGGAQRARRPGTTDQSLYPTQTRQSERDSPCFSGVFWGDLWLHFWDSFPSKVPKHQLTNFYRGAVFKSLRGTRKKGLPTECPCERLNRDFVGGVLSYLSRQSSVLIPLRPTLSTRIAHDFFFKMTKTPID